MTDAVPLAGIVFTSKRVDLLCGSAGALPALRTRAPPAFRIVYLRARQIPGSVYIPIASFQDRYIYIPPQHRNLAAAIEPSCGNVTYPEIGTHGKLFSDLYVCSLSVWLLLFLYIESDVHVVRHSCGVPHRIRSFFRICK